MERENDYIAEIYGLIETTNVYVEEIVEVLKNKEKQQAAGQMVELVDALMALTTALNQVSNVEMEKVDDVNINEVLTEMLQALQNEDDVLLMDLLQYEIQPILLGWKEYIETIRK